MRFVKFLLICIGLLSAADVDISVTNMTALKALQPGAYKSVKIKGFYTAQDGGEGVLYWNGVSTATVDSCTIYAPTINPTKPGRWIRPYVNSISVKGCGAKGDGIQNDGPYIQAALNVATLGTYGSTVRLVAGNYKINSTVTLQRDVNFIGEPNAYVVAGANNMAIFRTTALTARFKMSRIGMIGDDATNDTGIVGVQTRHNVVYEELYFQSLSVGISIQNLGWETTVRNCYAEACGIGFDVTNSSHQIIFDRCTALNSTNVGFYAHGETSDVEPILFKTMFLQCLAQGSTNYGIKLKNTGAAQIIGGYGEANVLSDIWADSSYYVVTDHFYGGGNIGASHIKLTNTAGANLMNVTCPGTRSVGTYDVGVTNTYCESNILRTGTLNLATGTITGIHIYQTTGTFSGDVTAGGNSSSARNFILNVTGTTTERLIYQTTGLDRWHLRKDAAGEGGANAGSNFRIDAYDDAGSIIDNVVLINRVSGGVFSVTRPSTFTSTTDATSSSAAAVLLSGGLGITKKLWMGNYIVPSTQTFSNVGVTVSAGVQYIGQTGTMSASRAVTLPAASSVPRGSCITVADESGSTTATNTLVLTRAGSDAINGATTFTIGVVGGYDWAKVCSDGTSKYTVVGFK